MSISTDDLWPGGLSLDILERARRCDEDVVVLPLREQDGLGVYSQESVFLVKELRAQGLGARFLHDSANRTFEVRNSAEAVVASLVLGVASSAAWDGVKMLLRRAERQQLKVTYVDLRHSDGRQATSWTATGDSEAVLDAIDRLRREQRD
jgi:hypothetical protein